ncbi:MAG: response regulator [Spirochaetes bacterium]|uniref:Response regulator n=1 Tax=Candidatus Ornithospirochaeta stercoripullorum TaxID=2840899 RepID=A0A9D9H4C6_9SPIO|nr:response regulator [Candidatus Ornithospirochaeta stercoripullorum]
MDAPYLTAILADDEPAITEGLSAMNVWQELGITVIATASTGQEALQKILSLKPDFAVMDIMMPGMTGLDVLEKLESATTDTDIIILSGYGNFDFARAALRFQAKAYLLKPVDSEELREILLELRKKRISGNEGTKISRQMLNDLSMGRLLDTSSITSLLSSGPDGLSDGSCFAMIITFPSSVKEGTLHVIEEAVAGERRIIWPENQRTVRAIFSVSSCPAFEIAEKILKALEENEFAIPTIGMGDEVRNLSSISSSFSRASLAMSYQLYDPDGRIFTSAVIATTPPDYKISDSDITPLEECIIENDKEGIGTFCASFIKKILGSTLPPPNYVYSITNWLIRETGKRFSMLLDGTGLLPEAPDITKYRTIPRLEEALTALFTRIASYIEAVYGKDEAIRKLEEKEEEDPVIKAMTSYVDSHAEEQIRLEDIADKVNLSPSYAAIYFRKKTGTTIREYILSKKMEEARKMLLEKDASVTDIAYRLGYHDYRSFSRAFKNITGKTPSEFQDGERL